MAEMHVRLGQLRLQQSTRGNAGNYGLLNRALIYRTTVLYIEHIREEIHTYSHTPNRFYSSEKRSEINISHYSLYFVWASFTLLSASTEIIFNEMIALWGTALFVLRI